MLVLSRTTGKAIIIDDNVEVTVLGVQGNSVRLGIKAPRDVSIHREEIYQRIQQEKQPQEQKQELGQELELEEE